MAKNNKRSKPKTASKSQPKPAIVEVEEEVVAPEPVTAELRAPRTPKISRSQAAAERIEDEYAYITGDLRRVFILAAVMFGLLIVLNIIFNAL